MTRRRARPRPRRPPDGSDSRFVSDSSLRYVSSIRCALWTLHKVLLSVALHNTLHRFQSPTPVSTILKSQRNSPYKGPRDVFLSRDPPFSPALFPRLFHARAAAAAAAAARVFFWNALKVDNAPPTGSTQNPVEKRTRDCDRRRAQFHAPERRHSRGHLRMRTNENDSFVKVSGVTPASLTPRC